MYGNIVSEDSSFYEYSLDKSCNATSWGDLSSMLTGWDMPSNLTNSTTVNCCDYYQRTVGYVFTECDNNINAVIIPNRTTSSQSMQYQ